MAKAKAAKKVKRKSDEPGRWGSPDPDNAPGRTYDQATVIGAERIRQRREQRQLSVEMAALTIGVTAKDWQGFEDGTKEPAFRHGLAMAVLFDVNAGWLSGMA